MGDWKRITVSGLIDALQKLPQDAPVAVRWDGGRSLFEIQQDEDGAVVLHAGWWSDFEEQTEPLGYRCASQEEYDRAIQSFERGEWNGPPPRPPIARGVSEG